MHFRDFRTGRPRRRGGRAARPGPAGGALNVEALESRTVLTATTSLAGGVLLISGGPGTDVIDVAKVPGNNLVVRDSGAEVARGVTDAEGQVELLARSMVVLRRVPA